MGDVLAAISLGTGRTAVAIAAGSSHTCALLNNGGVKCWGENVAGQLGQGDTEDRGDGPGEMGDALVTIDLGTGRTALAIGSAGFNTCALLDNGGVKCWGSTVYGQLGQGDTEWRGGGPGDMGDALAAVDIGGVATAIAVGSGHVCALLDDVAGGLRCWGAGGDGRLGNASTDSIGDDPNEMAPDDVVYR
jgi:alpha-tubulin suppressor-like RCC1 family protein